MGEQPSSGKRKGFEQESDDDGEDIQGSRSMTKNRGRDNGKERRKEQLGKKQVDKEVYRKEKIRKIDDKGQQWGR